MRSATRYHTTPTLVLGRVRTAPTISDGVATFDIDHETRDGLTPYTVTYADAKAPRLAELRRDQAVVVEGSITEHTITATKISWITSYTDPNDQEV